MHIISPSLRHVLWFWPIMRIQELHWCHFLLIRSTWVIKVATFLKLLWHAVHFVFVIHWAQSVELGSRRPSLCISGKWSWCLNWVLWNFSWLVYH
jgi:hypothetical protein